MIKFVVLLVVIFGCSESPRSSFIVILNTDEVPSQGEWGIVAKDLIEKWDRPVLDMLGVNLSTAIDTVFLTLRNVE